MKREEKVNEQQANQELDNFAEVMDLDFATDKMDIDDKKSFEESKRPIIRAIMYGNLTFNDNSEPVFMPQMGAEDKKALTFEEPVGASFKSMDQHKKNQDVTKMYGIMAEMTGTSIATFSKMKNRDIKVCTAIVTLFLG